jgi:nucleotide-binding universal stress UspA family protein
MDLLPENLSDYTSGPDLRYEVSGVRDWAFEQMARIEVFAEQAMQILIGMGYIKEDITVIVRDRVSDIVRDIAKEGRKRGYDALVAGHSTVNLIKDLPLESISERLVTLLSRLPVWVVGGSPDTSKILIAMDNSREAKTKRTLDYVADLFPNAPNPEFLLLHISSRMGLPEPEFRKLRSVHEGRDWTERVGSDFRAGEYGMESYFHECIAEMERRGIDRNRVKTKVIDESTSRSGAIMREALDGNYGTIVLGRRELSKIDEVIRGRVSNKVLQSATKNAVWVVH